MKLPRHECGLYLEHNVHKDYYENLEDVLNQDCYEDMLQEEKDEIIAADSLWTLQWYPDTPIGFYRVAASTLEKVLAKAMEVDNENKQLQSKG